jgi:iron complex outermembrane receptor protein
MRAKFKSPCSAGVFRQKWLKVAVFRALSLVGLLPVTAAMAQTDEVVVTATRVPTTDVRTPGAVDVIRLQNLRDSLPLIDAAEVLNRAPGVNVQSRQNYAQDTQISIRGFGSRASFGIRGIKIYVDDIPATIPDGQGQGAIVPFFVVDSLEVLRGPAAVGYGNAAGGVIAAMTRATPVGGGAEARLVVGPDATRLSAAQISTPRDLSDTTSAFIATQRLTSDGYRDHSRVKRNQTYAKLDVALAAQTSLTITGNRIDQPDTEDPLGLTRAQWDAAPRQVAAVATQFNTRKSIHHQQVGAVLSSAVSGLDLKAIVYGGTRDVVQYLSTPVAAQLPISSAGGVVDFARRFEGVGLRAANTSGALTWALGVDLDRARDDRKGFENFVQRGTITELGVRGNLRRDELNTQRANDFFGQFNWQLQPDLSLHAGLRRSDVKIGVEDRYIRAGNGDDSGSIRFAATSPSVSVSKQLSAQSSVYLTASRGFETPTAAELAYKPDQSAGLNFALRPSVARQWEGGWKFVNASTQVKAAVFDIRSQDEIVQASSVGGRSTFQNAAATSRRGAELSVNWKPTNGKPTNAWSAFAAITALEAKVSQAYLAGVGTAARTIPAGSAMPAVPRANLFAELSWHPLGRGAAGWLLSTEINARARIAADDANTAFAAGFATLSAMARYRFRGDRRIEIDAFVRVDNLADAKYAGSVIVNEANQRYFESAPGRRASVGVTGAVRF